MGKLPKKQNDLLKTCIWDLQQVLQEVIKYQPFLVIAGHINEETQTEHYMNKLTDVQWPDGRHNAYPSPAVDIAPFPVPEDWEKNIMVFYQLAAIVKFVAKSMNIQIKWRGDDIKYPTKIEDLIHFELIES